MGVRRGDTGPPPEMERYRAWLPWVTGAGSERTVQWGETTARWSPEGGLVVDGRAFPRPTPTLDSADRVLAEMLAVTQLADALPGDIVVLTDGPWEYVEEAESANPTMWCVLRMRRGSVERLHGMLRTELHRPVNTERVMRSGGKGSKVTER